MTASDAPPTPLVLASFFRRLESIEAIIRVIISQARLSVLLTFRGTPQKRVLLDFVDRPARILTDEEAGSSGDLYVTINGQIMHDILTGRTKPGLALGQRHLLLRGNAMHLSKFVPLLEFGPVLFREHLADLGVPGHARHPQNRPCTEAPMSEPHFEGKPIPVVQLSTPEKVLFKALNGISFGIGYCIGLLRYRVFKNLSLFALLASLSRGLEKATPGDA